MQLHEQREAEIRLIHLTPEEIAEAILERQRKKYASLNGHLERFEKEQGDKVRQISQSFRFEEKK